MIPIGRPRCSGGPSAIVGATFFRSLPVQSRYSNVVAGFSFGLSFTLSRCGAIRSGRPTITAAVFSARQDLGRCHG